MKIRSNDVSFLENIVSYYALVLRVIMFYGRSFLKRFRLEKILVKLKLIKYKKYLVTK